MNGQMKVPGRPEDYPQGVCTNCGGTRFSSIPHVRLAFIPAAAGVPQDMVQSYDPKFYCADCGCYEYEFKREPELTVVGKAE